MRVLIGCERSGVIRDAFRRVGHEAWSCDLAQSENGHFHIQGDVLEVIQWPLWDLFICHPPCTFICGSGMHWTTRGLRDPKLTEDAVEFAVKLWHARIPRIALENPVGILRLEECSQTIQPYQFGDDASKRTCLWLKNLPLLSGTHYVKPRIVPDGPYAGAERWANQTDSGQNRLGPSETRAIERSRTYQGIADAMAIQWGVDTLPPIQPDFL